MNCKKALVVGGSNGVGLSIVNQLLQQKYEKIYIVDKEAPDNKESNIIEFIKFNLLSDDYSIFESFDDIDTLIITAGFGRVSSFENLNEIEIINSFKVNTISVIRIINKFYKKLLSKENLYCAVMGSISGLVSSPLFSIYGSTKAAVCNFIESINIELEMKKSNNRILNVSPGSIKGTKFNNGNNDINLTSELSKNILYHMFNREKIFIPDYEKVYKGVIERYKENPDSFGKQSYEYKVNSNRSVNEAQVKVGYLSGTFDLFHIGHLNLLRRAKEYCDYLVVGVHKDGSHKNKETYIPFKERVEIVKGIRYVDEVIESLPEDSSVYDLIKYKYLFVGSDYAGTERFKKYEEFFLDKNVDIIYLPYTKGTSSTQLRLAIDSICE